LEGDATGSIDNVGPANDVGVDEVDPVIQGKLTSNATAGAKRKSTGDSR
jgi:hypothetical protein